MGDDDSFSSLHLSMSFDRSICDHLSASENFYDRYLANDVDIGNCFAGLGEIVLLLLLLLHYVEWKKR